MAWAIREHIEIAPEDGRLKPRIAGSRIRVQDAVIWYEKLGMSADEIVHNYPTVTLADVHAALAYYWDHHDEIERAIVDEKAFADEFRRDYIGPLRRKLMSPPLAIRGCHAWTSNQSDRPSGHADLEHGDNKV